MLSWGFGDLGTHRIELEVLADNNRAINCCLACGFRHEGIRRQAGLHPDGWKDFLLMGLLQAEHQFLAKTSPQEQRLRGAERRPPYDRMEAADQIQRG